ncbi:hypothetical protein PIB30_075704 [Stylosanthes scabra]|uniref:Putative plant transposon protein domain-containing protein n=1 Tax=Stylosanthes scabra TaxID=79078 RepID=A0ABU6XPQ0_9FABA|nr:hypothetical protein [Stylosanthes scabra]
MASSSSSGANAFDNHRFRTLFNQRFYEETVCKKEIIAEVGFDLNEDEYPEMRQQIALRGWRRLASPREVTKTMIREFFANAARSEDEMDDLIPVARGWQEFIINNIIPTGNKSKITVSRAVLIHCIMRGEDVRAEELIADNIAIIAQGLASKCLLGFPSTIYKLCKEAGVRMREFKRMKEVDVGRYITKDVMKTVRIPRIFLPIIDHNEGDDIPIPQYEPPFIPEVENADIDQDQEQHQHFEHPPPHFEQQPQQFPQQQPQYVTYADFQQFQQTQVEQMQQYQQTQVEQMQQYQQKQTELQQLGFQKLTDQIANMQIGIQTELGNYKQEIRGLKDKQQKLYNHYNNLYNYMKEKQRFIAKELDEIKRFQVGQTMTASSQIDPIEKVNRTLQEHCNEMTMIKRQLKE